MGEAGENKKARILIVEDDEAVARGLALNLNLEGFVPESVHDGESALERIKEELPELILLDISLPGMSGLDVLREIRQEGVTTPVIVLSARQDEYDKVAALRLGADDYVTKPFSIAELLARIDAVLRRAVQAQAPAGAPAGAWAGAHAGSGDSQEGGQDRSAAAGTHLLEIAGLHLNLDTREVRRGEEMVRFTHLEFELLSFLAQNAAKVFSRDQILQKVWGINHSGSARTVDNFIGQLRAKLEDDPNHPRHIVTVRGSGYRFDP